jgi:hypothetical protein
MSTAGDPPAPATVTAPKEKADMNISSKSRSSAILRTVASTGTIAALLFTVGCSSGGGSASSSGSAAPRTVAPATDITAQASYPASTDQNFMSACEQTSNGDVGYCQCTLNWFQANVSYTQFLADEDMVRAGQIPADVTSAESACGR